MGKLESEIYLMSGLVSSLLNKRSNNETLNREKDYSTNITGRGGVKIRNILDAVPSNLIEQRNFEQRKGKITIPTKTTNF